MDNNIEQLTQLTAEMEGLLYVIAKRDSQELRNQLSAKYHQFTTLMEGLLAVDTNYAPYVEEAKCDEAEDAEVTPETIAATEAIDADQVINDISDDNEMSTLHAIETEQPSNLRVDQMLAQREAQNLRKAYTLNDKFRFRRELFNNDDDLFGKTLDTLQQMQTYTQAVEYVENEFGWDLENEEVADFMATVKNHFSTK